jgi:ribosomal protein S4
MSRYRGPKLRITRRLGNLPGLTQKKSKKLNKPGQHGKILGEGKKKTTEYGIRLEEKQKLKFNYGLTESQLYHYIKEARRRKGVTGLILLQLLEMRLDTICFSLGYWFSVSIFKYCRKSFGEWSNFSYNSSSYEWRSKKMNDILKKLSYITYMV